MHGHPIDSKDDGRILAANIKYKIAEEASHLPHFRSIPWLHEAVDQRQGLHRSLTCKTSHQS